MHRSLAVLPPIAALLLAACAEGTSPVAPSGSAPRYDASPNATGQDRTTAIDTIYTLCDGTALAFQGQSHTTSRLSQAPGGTFHTSFHGNTAGTATSSTGEQYTFNATFNYELNMAAGETTTQVNRIHLISRDGTPNQTFTLVDRITVNANGEVTSEAFSYETTGCPATAQ